MATKPQGRTHHFDSVKFVHDLRWHRTKLRENKPNSATSASISKLTGISTTTIDRLFNHDDIVPELINFIQLCFWMQKDPANYFITPEWCRDMHHLTSGQLRTLTIGQKKQLHLYNDLAIDAATYGYASAHLGISDILTGLRNIISNFFLDHKIPYNHEAVTALIQGPQQNEDLHQQKKKAEVIPFSSERTHVRKGQ